MMAEPSSSGGRRSSTSRFKELVGEHRALSRGLELGNTSYLNSLRYPTKEGTVTKRLSLGDRIVRPIFIDDAGHQYVIDRDGHTRRYVAWLRPEDEEADVPLVVTEPGGQR